MTAPMATQPATKVSPELVERMVALIRDLHADHVTYDMHDREQDFVARTAAIVADFPDPDFSEARRIIADTYGQTRDNDNRLMLGDGPARVENIKEGKGDIYWEMRCVVAAIKRGRELAAQVSA